MPPDPDRDYAFARLAGDVLAVLDHLGVTEWNALGESLGGGVACLVDEARPGATRTLLLCEAIAFTTPARPPRPTPDGSPGGNYMATIARKRRAVWPDRATVLASYGSRPPLDVLDPAALAGVRPMGLRRPA